MPHKNSAPAAWELSLEAPSVVPATDPGEDISQLEAHDPVVSGRALAAGRRVVLLDAGDVLTDNHELPSQGPEGTTPSLNGQHLHVKFDDETARIPVHVDHEQDR